MSVLDQFQLTGRTVIITGGAGLLGKQYAKMVLEAGGIPVLLDISEQGLQHARNELTAEKDAAVDIYVTDITNRESIQKVCDCVLEERGRIDVLINNAANNPKMEGGSANMQNIRFENFPIDMWNADLQVGLTGAVLCAQVFGARMAEEGKGVILNISSDLGIIAPDQRIYRKEGLQDSEQMVKPVTYSVIKHGIIGLTKYLATYWAEKGIRCNALCPAGVWNGQEEEFVGRLSALIPMGRMAEKEEYCTSVLYLISDASSYMTGATVIVDGGRTCW